MIKRLYLLAFMLASATLFAAKCEPLLKSPEFATPIKYERETPFPGVIYEYYLVKDAFGGPQSISLVVVDFDCVENGRRWRAGFGLCDGKYEHTSAIAKRMDADIAVNASFFAMRTPKEPKTLFRMRVDGKSIGFDKDVAFSGMTCFNSDELPAIAPLSPGVFAGYRNGLQSFPVLVTNGKVTGRYPAAATKPFHPRTVIGATADNKLMLITIDGRHMNKAGDGELALGMKYDDMAALAVLAGCKDAVNFDGGGSTTLYIKGRGVVNYPCDNKRYDHGGERIVHDIFYLKFEKPPAPAPRKQ